MTAESALWQALVQHETARSANRLAAAVQREVNKLHTEITKPLGLSQVRSLVRALAPQGAGDTPAQRLARLHDLAASQLRRAKKRDEQTSESRIQLPTAVSELSAQEEGLPATFWGYVVGRLRGLRSADWANPGVAEQVWQVVCTRYENLGLPATAPPATLEEIHLQLAETFVYYCCETWEYREPEGGRA